MSQYCANCGTALPAAAAFCPACGASSSAAGASPPYQPSLHQPSYTQSNYAGPGYSRSGHSAVGLSAFAAMFLPFKRYVDFEGRSTRLEYWMFTLLWWIVIILFTGMIIVDIPPSGQPNAEPGPLVGIGAVLLMLWIMATVIPCIALTVRRLHDQDKSGGLAILFYVLSFLFSFLGWIVQTIFMCLPGTAGPNQYGPDPFADHAGDVFA